TVYGGVAGDVMGRDIATMTVRDPDPAVLEAEIARALHPFSKPVSPVVPHREALQEAMWEGAGVMRTEAGLTRAVSRITEIAADLAETGVDGTHRAFNLTWHDWLNMASLTEVSAVIAEAALARENSRGAHYREDFPDQGDLATSYFTIARQTAGRLDVTRAPVAFTIVKPGDTILPEGEPETLVAAQ
ncbi:MAG: succinate dehydrogenase/fumarate reductase flavoprotein subunit, partial [Pseudomonadota bacterium]